MPKDIHGKYFELEKGGILPTTAYQLARGGFNAGNVLAHYPRSVQELLRGMMHPAMHCAHSVEQARRMLTIRRFPSGIGTEITPQIALALCSEGVSSDEVANNIRLIGKAGEKCVRKMDNAEVSVRQERGGKGERKFLKEVLDPKEVLRYQVQSRWDLSQILTDSNYFKEHSGEIKSEREAAFNLFKTLLANKNINAIDEDDLHSLLYACFLTTNGQGARMTITTGYCAGETMPSLRVPSYIVCGLELMQTFLEEFKEGNVKQMPVFRILVAKQVAEVINQRNPQKLGQSHRAMIIMIEEFIEEFCPELQEYIIIESDQDIVIPTAEESRHLTSTKFLQDKMKDDMEDFQGRIQRQASRVLGNGNGVTADSEHYRIAAHYAVAHPHIFLDMMHEKWHQKTPHWNNPPDVIVSIGGAGEDFFSYMRLACRPLFEEFTESYPPVSVHIPQKSGQYPPYMPKEADFGIDTIDPREDYNPFVDFKKFSSAAERKSLIADCTALQTFVRNTLAIRRDMSPKNVTDDEVAQSLRTVFNKARRKIHTAKKEEETQTLDKN